MKLDITFSVPGQPPQTLSVSPTSINVPNTLWWLLHRLFPAGFYPFLDPQGVYQGLSNLPPSITLPDGTPVCVNLQRSI